jgi:hypothetical protein
MQAQQASSPMAASASSSPLSAPSEPGEFTRMLESPLAPRGSPMPASAQSMFPPSTPGGSAMEGGEFARMLDPRPAPMPAQPPSMFPPAAPSGGGIKEPGEFTRMLESPFQPQGLVGQPAAAPPPRQPTGDATRAFQVQQAQQGGAAPAEQGPSEFTKMFKAPVLAPPAPPEPKVVKRPTRPPIPKKKSNSLLWILIVIAVVLALALIVYLIVR